MNIIKKTQGVLDQLSGMSKKWRQKRRDIPFDEMQQYMTVGEYQVGSAQDTPNGEDYDLIVYKDDEGTLHQALRPVDASDLAPEYVRKFDKRLDRYQAFVNKKTGRRYIVERQLDDFVDYVNRHIRKGNNSVNIGV